MKKKLLSILLTAAMTVSMVSVSAVTGFAGSGSGNPDGIYIKQDYSGRCTLAAAVMVMRQKAFNEGNPTWMNLTQSSVGTVGWIDGTGIRTEFTYGGLTVKRANFTDNDEDIKAELLSLLDQHPEGLSVYDRGVPHAVFLTRYDAETDTFYCADPGLSTDEMRLDQSWLTHVGGSSTQDAIVAALDQYWYVSSYTAQSIPAYSAPSDDTGSSAGGGSDAGTGAGSEPEEVILPVVNPVADDASVFPDVTPDDWFYSFVMRCYELGFMSGTPEDGFRPDDSVKANQAITMAARIYSAYAGDGEDFAPVDGGEWYTPYVEYALAKGIVSQSFVNSINMEGAISRSDFVYTFNKAMSGQNLAVINDIADGYFSDVSENSSAGKAIYKFARAGIIAGFNGKFNPSGSITRAEAAVVVTHAADPESRINI